MDNPRRREVRKLMWAAIALTVAWAIYATMQLGQLPTPMAVGFNLTGTKPYNFGSPAVFVWGNALIAVVVSVFLCQVLRLGAPPVHSFRLHGGMMLATSSFLGTYTLGIVLGQVGLAEAAHAQFSPLWGVVALVIALIFFLLGRVIVNPAAVTTTASGSSVGTATAPSPEQIWVGNVRIGRKLSAVLIAIGCVFVPLGCLFHSVSAMVVGVVLPLIIFHLLQISVTIDADGIRVGLLLHTISITVPWDKVTGAEPLSVTVDEYGGWGVRLSEEQTALVLSDGAGLKISAAMGEPGDVIVGIDDAETASQTINYYLGRQTRLPG
ncbi:MAG: hypothetical protein Q4D85_04180 [Corynebacterium sp.]|uniref:hypothetical protein n=1 Tax=Corynebacterium sp. TaxID=1720 RepID=UPI0026DAF830|nr:hypothetical protein [Corynebacterium sp.]MDO5097934.1 hypothetical protein [Corynebacterium sp.]